MIFNSSTLLKQADFFPAPVPKDPRPLSHSRHNLSLLELELARYTRPFFPRQVGHGGATSTRMCSLTPLIGLPSSNTPMRIEPGIGLLSKYTCIGSAPKMQKSHSKPTWFRDNHKNGNRNNFLTIYPPSSFHAKKWQKAVEFLCVSAQNQNLPKSTYADPSQNPHIRPHRLCGFVTGITSPPRSCTKMQHDPSKSYYERGQREGISGQEPNM
jgi:hypothetical protein